MQFRQSIKTGIIIAVLSLFMQTMNWVLFEKLGYDAKFTLITPLVLCLMYHFVQLDASRDGNLSRGFFFLFSVAVPFAFGLILTIVMLLTNPRISTFSADVPYTGTAPEVISTYAGRYMFTSLYMAIFALIDIPVLKYCDKRREEK